MKYGESLQQRSIPEWGPYNVDYDEIKQLIKARTTKDHAQAIVIPGSSHGDDKALQEFENDLYAELCEQHQRINLFVRSKSGEISRRLAHLQKVIGQLGERDIRSTRNKIPMRRLERLSKLEGDVLKTGEEIRSLSRFLGAQRLAFQKLLKKYRKWTGSAVLGQRFAREVLNQPTTFAEEDFEPLLAQWTDVLAAVRTLFSTLSPCDTGSNLEGSLSPSRRRTNDTYDVHREESTYATQMQSASHAESNVEFDTALATLPLGSKAGKAIYWVHRDNLVGLQVLLLQHMRLKHTDRRMSGTPSLSPGLSRNSSYSGSHLSRQKDEDTHLMIFDDLERFSRSQSGSTISEAGDGRGRSCEKATVSVRWASGNDATVAVRTDMEKLDELEHEQERSIRVMKLKRKYLRPLFDTDAKPPTPSPQQMPHEILTEVNTLDQDTLTQVREWYSKHKVLHPLVHIRSQRARYVGLGNTSTDTVCAVLDQDIVMDKALLNQLGPGSELPATETNGHLDEPTEFPHAILEVRWEFESALDLIRSLDQSHLTERVRGFDLETHAIAMLYKPKDLSPPFWLHALERDIRKIPERAKAGSRSTRSAVELPKTGTASTSTTSGTNDLASNSTSAPAIESSATSVPDAFESTPTRAYEKKRKTRRQYPIQEQEFLQTRNSQQRYWNEYDSPEDSANDEPYTIFVDPRKSVDFPGRSILSRASDAIVRMASASTAKGSALLHWKRRDGEQRPLLDGGQSRRPGVGESDLEAEDEASSTENGTSPRRQYSTFPYEQDPHGPFYGEVIIFRAYAGCFLASIIILSIVSILAVTGRHREKITVDIGVMTGITTSLAFAVVGTGMMLVRKDNLSWMHRILVLSIFAIICVANGVVLAMILGSIG
ncbi:MAG: hypothetical protein M1819_001979 [Sarea resinae]|nr:MAG: hypothetical protein M1819_001979 [Sarea resinae]